MFPRLSARLLATLALTAALPTVQGCEQPKKKSEVRAETGAQCLTTVMEARRKKMTELLPKSEESDDEHPWLAYIKKISAVPPITEFKACAVEGAGSPAEEQGTVLARFVESQREYFQNEKRAPKEYWADLQGAQRVSQSQKWEADLEFEVLYWHLAELARSWTLFSSDTRDDRVLRFFSYQLRLWGFDAKTSLYTDEVGKMCKEKLGDVCKDMPDEDRPFFVMGLYFEAMAKKIDDYIAKYPQAPYNEFLKRAAAVYRDRAAKVPKHIEFPVLPGIRSTVSAPYSGNATLMLSKKGVALMDANLRLAEAPPPAAGAKPTPPWKADWLADPALIKEAATVVESVRSNTVSPYSQSTLYVVPEPEVPVGYIAPILRATITGPASKNWFSFVLVGRTRFDGTNRRSGYTVSLIKPELVTKFSVIHPGTKKKLACEAFAAIGKDQIEAKAFKPIVLHGGDQVYTGRLADSGELTDLQAAPPHGDGERLESWAAAQNMSIVVAVPESATYAQWIEALNGVAYVCEKDNGCLVPRATPVFLATCK